MPGKPLSSVDTAWLRMEDPTNLMMITGVMLFDAPMDFKRLKATLENRVLCFERFKQRVIQPKFSLSAPYWEDDPDFDLGHHLKRLRLPPGSGQAELQDIVSELMSTPLDFSRPLWQLHLVDNYGDGCALIARLHHCIADGIALMYVLFSMADKTPEARLARRSRKARPRGEEPLALPGPLRPVAQVANTLWRESMETLAHPSHVLDLARLGADGTAALARLVFRWPDPHTIFKGPLGVEKRAAWSRLVPLDEVKAMGRVKGATINDVMLTAVAGALRRYMQERGAPADDVAFRGVLPVNLRPRGIEAELGNKFGLVFVSLPIDMADPLERLAAVKQNMDELKGTPEAVVAFGILNAMGMSPAEVQNIVVNIFGAKGTAVITNVPGPREKLYLAGAPMNSVLGWVPQAGHLGLGISIISYAGQIRVGVATDRGLVRDPEAIVAAFHAEFDALARVLRKARIKRSRAVAPMMARLDDALKSLDALLEARQTAGD